MTLRYFQNEDPNREAIVMLSQERPASSVGHRISFAKPLNKKIICGLRLESPEHLPSYPSKNSVLSIRTQSRHGQR
jgi:hypothetical protein